MSQRVDLYGPAKSEEDGAIGKPSMNSAFVVQIRPEAGRAYLGQDELCRNTKGGPNDRAVQHSSMN
jgi:hypothetical protein